MSIQKHMTQYNVIAIDGPSGAGKSTIAKEVAKRLGYIHLDTGAMYRACTWYALDRGLDILDQKVLEPAFENFELNVRDVAEGNCILVNGKDVTEFIRSPLVTEWVARVCQYPFIREMMIQMQRKIGQENNCVLDGRDIGGVVFPDARFKFFLTASLDVRAKRRFNEIKNKDKQSFVMVKEKMKQRDALDKKNTILAPDAQIIDSTHLTKENVIDLIINRVNEGLNNEE